MSQTSKLNVFGSKCKNPNVDEKKRAPKPSDGHKSESESGSDSEERYVPKDGTITDSLIRQNFPVEIEKSLNKQINLERQAWYTYQSMGIYFLRHDVALRGFSKFFMDKAAESREHAMRIMKHVIKSGGLVTFQDIPKPVVDSWGTGLAAMLTCLDMEKSLNESLLYVHKLTVKLGVPHTEKFVKKFISEHVVIIKILGEHVTNIERVGPKGLPVYMFDMKTLKGETVAKRTKVIKVIKIAKRHGNKSDSDSSDSSDSDSD